jgi:hypothetical protein
MLGALDSLRVHSAESLGDAGLSLTAPPLDGEPSLEPTAGEPSANEWNAREASATDAATPAAGPAQPVEPLDHLFRPTTRGDDAHRGAAVPGQGREAASGDEGSIFDNPRPGSFVPTSEAVYDVGSADEAERREEAAPRSATEAFLLSAHLDHGDPPLPPTDDADVGARYARDAMRATARAKTRREEPSRDDDPQRPAGGHETGEAERDESDESPEAETSGKPLGWLFRSSS